MILSRLKVGPIQTNCYVVKSDTSDVGFVVDPGASADKILEEVDKLGVRVKYVVLTHGHFDHVLGVPGLLEKWPGIPVYVHEKEVNWAGAGFIYYKMSKNRCL